jgi:hypothetical protein
MELIGILGGLLLVGAALWGLLVGVAVSLGFRRARPWARLLVSCIGCVCVWWIFAASATPDGASLGTIARRSLVLLDLGLLVAGADTIARITRWVDKHAYSAPG